MKHQKDKIYKAFLRSFLLKSRKELLASSEEESYQKIKQENIEQEQKEIHRIKFLISLITIVNVLVSLNIRSYTVIELYIYLVFSILPLLLFGIRHLIKKTITYKEYVIMYDIFMTYIIFIYLVLISFYTFPILK